MKLILKLLDTEGEVILEREPTLDVTVLDTNLMRDLANDMVTLARDPKLAIFTVLECGRTLGYTLVLTGHGTWCRIEIPQMEMALEKAKQLCLDLQHT